METKTQRQPKRWTADEDVVLYEEAMKQASSGSIKDWSRIAEKLQGRTNKDCRKRWINKVCGGLKRGTWSESEDQMLREAVATYGQRWTKVAQKCDGRSPDQCAKRWQFTLDPKLEHREWTNEEDALLLRLVRLVGRDWKFICSNHYPTRSRNDLKNRHTILSRRSISNGSTSGVDEVDEVDAQPLQDNSEVRINSPIASGPGSVIDVPKSQYPDPGSLSVRDDESSLWLDDAQPEQPDNHDTCQDDIDLIDFDMSFQTSANFFELFPESSTSMGENENIVPATATPFPPPPEFSTASNHNVLPSNNMELTSKNLATEAPAKENYRAQYSTGLDMATGYHTPLTAFSNENPIQPMGFPSSGRDSSVSKLVLIVEECDFEIVKYLIDITGRLRGKVKLEIIV